MRSAILEKQNKDLRVRLENQAAKFEMKAAQYEEEILELKEIMGTMPNQVSMLQAYILEREAMIDALKLEILDLKGKLSNQLKISEKLGLIINKLKARLKKNSSTSDKPPSSDAFVKPKTQSMREKSGKQPGGQFGHEGHGPKLFEEPTRIIEKKPCSCGKCGSDIDVCDDYIRRQVVDFDISVNVIEERVYSATCPNCGNTETETFDDEFKGPMQYGVSIKSLIAMLNAYGCVADLKSAEILNSISGGLLNMSAGTVVNIRKALSEKLDDTIDAIREALILSGSLTLMKAVCVLMVS